MSPRALLIRSVVRWLFLTIIILAVGLSAAWVVTITPDPTDYRIQLPTMELP